MAQKMSQEVACGENRSNGIGAQQEVACWYGGCGVVDGGSGTLARVATCSSCRSVELRYGKHLMQFFLSLLLKNLSFLF